jgi:hypothetical protein
MQSKLLKYGTFIVTEVFDKDDWWITNHNLYAKELQKQIRTGKITAYGKGGIYIAMNPILGPFRVDPKDVMAYGPAAELLYG